MSVTRKQLPAYWEKHVAEKIAQIKTLQAKTKDCFCVGMITDFHWLENEKYSVPLLERILADCQIPYFFQAGDIVSGQGICPPSRIVVEMVDNQTEFSEIITQCLYVEGNHDRAYSTFAPPAYYKENIPKAEFDETYFRTVKRIATNYAEGGYYYVDDEKAKVRYIALNSHDVPDVETDENGYSVYNPMTHYGFRQKQIEWFAQVALAVPSREWTVIVCSHATPNGVQEERNIYNYGLMTGLINAFQKGEKYAGRETHENSLFDGEIQADYTGKGGTFLVWLGGHTHDDAVAVVDGLTCVETTSDARYVGLHPERKETVNEQAFDILVFDKQARQCTAVRIGAGENREFPF